MLRINVLPFIHRHPNIMTINTKITKRDASRIVNDNPGLDVVLCRDKVTLGAKEIFHNVKIQVAEMLTKKWMIQSAKDSIYLDIDRYEDSIEQTEYYANLEQNQQSNIIQQDGDKNG